jgi:hypothetical protein
MQELVTARELRQQPAAHEVYLRPEIMRREPDRLILAYITICARYDTPKLTAVLEKLGLWTGMLLFSMSFYYGLARLVMWAASRWI